MSRGLLLAKDLAPLPLDLAVEATAVIGKRGRGKTYGSKRLVEEVIRAGVTVVIIDPTDVWWGLQSGADGKADGGIDIIIIGGKHGNLPLRPGTGKPLARAVLEGTSMIVVTKGLPKAERRRIVGELLTELYDLADGSHPVLVVIDEADEYAPEGQKPIGNKTTDPLILCAGAIEDVVRRGRAGGLGTLLITQRVAVLSKNVLEQSDTLIAFGVTGKNDIDSVAAWIGKHAPDTETGKRITSSLPSLPKGRAWVWSPEYGVLDCVDVLPISTFDSSRSPKVGEVIAAPRSRKAIDIAAFGAEMEKFAEEVKADDPAELKKQIADLKRQLAQRQPTEPERVEVPVEVKVPVLSDEDRHLIESTWQATLQAGSVLTKQGEAWQAMFARIAEQIGQIKIPPFPRVETRQSSAASPTVTRTPPTRAKAEGSRPKPPRADNAPRTSPTSAGSNGHVDLSQAEMALLKGLGARHPIPMTLRELGTRTRRSHTSSTTQTAIGHLRALGLVTGSNRELVATEAGIAIVGGGDEMPLDRGLIEWWASRLTTAEAALMRTLVAEWPAELTNEELAERAGYSTTSSTFQTAMGRLRSLGLAVRQSGANIASDELGEAWASG